MHDIRGLWGRRFRNYSIFYREKLLRRVLSTAIKRESKFTNLMEKIYGDLKDRREADRGFFA